jgi:hypothetical protein
LAKEGKGAVAMRGIGGGGEVLVEDTPRALPPSSNAVSSVLFLCLW